MGKIITMPLAAAVGATHISVAQCSSGWAVMAWSRDTGRQMAGGPVPYGEARERAKAYADRTGAVLDLPEGFGLMHVLRHDGGEYEVLQVSSSEGSAASLAVFGPHEREEAVRYALKMLPQYQPCRLGEVG